MKPITLTTDFGPGEYVATMKGVILSIAEDARILDISHTVQPQDIEQGAYVLYSALQNFREGVHIGVIDPGVGTERKGVIVECESHLLVGPDNGLLMPAAKKLGMRRVFEIRRREYLLEEMSSTFHGRDVFAPVAAHLSLGVSPEKIGEVLDDWVDLDFGTYEARGKELKGNIIHIDSFGNLISNIPIDVVLELFDFGQRMEIRTGGKRLSASFSRTYSGVKENEILVTASSSDFLEVAANQGSAAAKLGAKRGNEIHLSPAG
ncbi:MAG: S-adenosyl-l-methionine hydroxide adenosyltransferase family protein [Thermoplasmata archaeon]